MLFFAASLQFAEINLIPSYDRITYRRENETTLWKNGFYWRILPILYLFLYFLFPFFFLLIIHNVF